MRTLNKTKINSAILLVVSLAANNSAHALSSVAIDCGWVPGMTSTSYVLPCGYTTEYLDEMEEANTVGAVGIITNNAGLSSVTSGGAIYNIGVDAYNATKVTGVVHGTPAATAAAANYKAPEVVTDAKVISDANIVAANNFINNPVPAPTVTAPSKPIEAPKPVVQAPTPTVDVKPVEVVKPVQTPVIMSSFVDIEPVKPVQAVTAQPKPVEAPRPVVQAPMPVVDVMPIEIVKPVPVIQMPIVNAKPEIIKPQPIIEVEHEDVKPQETVKPVKPVDTIVHNYAPTDTLHVYLSRNGNSFNPVLVNGGTQERVNLGGINKANLNGTEYGISYLQAPAQSMQDMGVLAKLITGQPAGVANLQASATIGNTSDLINSYISSDIISSTIATLSAHDLAATLVKNALGSTDAGTIQWVEDFLRTHTLAELVELAVKNEAVIDHAFGSEGLMLI